MSLHGLVFILMLQTAVKLESDNSAIRETCTVALAKDVIADSDGNGVIHIATDNVVVDFAGATLRGAVKGSRPDSLSGVGIRITGKNVTLRNANVAGFKCGIFASGADNLTLENCDVSDNFGQHLKSTPAAENAGDWLWPHRNDGNEWVNNYGAGICIEDAKSVAVRRCRARRGQNGLILDRVIDSKVYDNDFSFLSGWGLAMWRCERNLISRNALDFCVRGYSHGVYNRGQDSAGILFFEQNIDNVLIENSATHGGDGFFGFGGREALGEDWIEAQKAEFKKKHNKDSVDADIAVPAELAGKYRKRGNRGNHIMSNDFSYAPAHGLELTFSFDNQISGNRFIENAICGIWGGYSQNTLICQNTFERNGDAGYGLERGGVNIEHGRGNTIISNEFRGNVVGVHLWWDADAGLLKLPWAVANGAASEENAVLGNTFDGDRQALHLRESKKTWYAGNRATNVGKEVDATPGSEPETEADEGKFGVNCSVDVRPMGETRPVGARAGLRGREKIIVTEWGPYDWQAPYLQLVSATGGQHLYRVLGEYALVEAAVVGDGVRVEADKDARPATIRVMSDRRSTVSKYSLNARTTTRSLETSGTLMNAEWRVTVFPWTHDPRENVDEWRKETAGGRTFTCGDLSLRYGNNGPSQLADAPQALREAKFPTNKFGTLAETELTLSAGEWRFVTESDDGIRVWVDGKLVIDDWTWHAPKKADALFKIDAEKKVAIRVEHFELDGFAVLTVEVEPK